MVTFGASTGAKAPQKEETEPPSTALTAEQKVALEQLKNPPDYLAEVFKAAEELKRVHKEKQEKEAREAAERQRKAEEAKRIAAANAARQAPTPRAAQPQPVPQATAGSAEEALRVATVAAFGEGQWPYMRNLIMKESGLNPNAVNPSSGACGLFQALPCSKMGGMALDNQIRWGIGYVKARYGTPSNAWAFWLANNWY